MERGSKIIIVENDLSGAAKLSLHLSELGYDISGIFPRLKEAAHFTKKEKPDLILVHDKFINEMDSMEEMNNQESSPIVFFNKENGLGEAHRSLSFKNSIRQQILKAEIKKAFKRLRKKYRLKKVSTRENPLLSDRIFVRHKDKMVKIALNEIQYIEADRNYCKLFTKTRQYLLVSTLKQVASKLPEKIFVRIHRSYIANLFHIDEIGQNYVVISSRSLPLSKNMRTGLFNHLQVL